MSKRIIASMNDGDGKINIVLDLEDISMVIVPESLIVMNTGHTVHLECQELVKVIANKFWQQYSNGVETTDFTGQPVPVSFDVYKDQWVKAKLITLAFSSSKLKEGEEYWICPYATPAGEKRVSIRIPRKRGKDLIMYEDWHNIQFELVDVKKGGEDERT